MDLTDRVRQTIEQHELLISGDTVVVGVSGGTDSLCLLHLLREMAPAFGVTLHAGHLDHRMRPESGEDARFVAQLSESWDIPCTVKVVDVPAWAASQGLSSEEAARQARYTFLGDLARHVGGRTVAVAHHGDDQVETVLMHFIRGSGLAGLRGMRPLSRLDDLSLAPGFERQPSREHPLRLVRPLLEVSRADIEAYCESRGLEPRFDRSNLDTTFFRNRLRHELIPCLETYNPNVREVIRRTAEAVAGDYALMRDLLTDIWPQVVRTVTSRRIILDLAALRDLPVGLQRSVLREAVHRLRRSLRDISWIHIEDALHVLQHGHVGAQATLPGGLMMILGYDRVMLAPEGIGWPPEDRPRVYAPVSLAVPGRTELPDSCWRVVAQRLQRDELPKGWDRDIEPYRAFFDAARLKEPLVLRSRQTGDMLVPLGLEHRQKVHDLMINAKIPRQQRDSVPLLISAGEVAWVVGGRIDARYAVTHETDQVLCVWFEKDPLTESEDASC